MELSYATNLHLNYVKRKALEEGTHATRLTVKPKPTIKASLQCFAAKDVSDRGLNISENLDAYIPILSNLSSTGSSSSHR